MKRVAFLLGAGASIPAGYSSTDCLTRQILAPKGYFLHTDKRFVAGDQSLHMDAVTPLVRRIIRWLFERTLEYFLRRTDTKEINYEDLYYLASQLADDATELQNPALLPLIERLAREMTLWPEYSQYCDYNGSEWKMPTTIELHELCEKACHYIEDIVTHVLGQQGQGRYFQHLKLIRAVFQADDLDLKGIATLAHDTHVETHLRNEGIRLSDGFSDLATGCGWRVWQDRFPVSGFVPLVKLHGSVDWKHLRLDGHIAAPQFTVGIGGGAEQPSGIMPLHSAGAGSAVYRQSANGRPLLLIGTFNKPSRYSWDLMLDSHYRFRKILDDSETLIICGYSFGDKAINTQIVFWHSLGRSLVVIDRRYQSQVLATARYAAHNSLNSATTQFISKPMEEVHPDQLMDKL